MLMLADDVLLLKDFASATGADTVRTFDSENLRGPKMLALSLTLTISSVGAGGEGEPRPVITSLVVLTLWLLLSPDLVKEEIAKSSGRDCTGGTKGFFTEVITWVLYMTASGVFMPVSSSREGLVGICCVFFRSIFFREILDDFGDWGLKLGLSGGETEIDLVAVTLTELPSPSQEEVPLTFFFLAKVEDK